MPWSDLVTAYLRHDHSGPAGGLPRRSAAVPGAVQPGIICLWNGSVASIPAGWALCNGANGTPDMRNRFIRGAGGGYAEGAAGGTDTHNFSHSHGASVGIANAGNHQHTTAQTATAGGNAVRTTDTNVGGGTNFNHTHPAAGSSFAGDHGHGVTGTSVDAQLGAVDNRPVFYTLAFMMKL